jgi:hypothetical protein
MFVFADASPVVFVAMLAVLLLTVVDSAASAAST